MSAIEQAAERVGETWDEYAALDLGPKMTCAEVEALAALFEAIGQSELASALIEGHAEEDDEGDMHYEGAA